MGKLSKLRDSVELAISEIASMIREARLYHAGDPDVPASAYRGGHTAPVDPEYHAPLHDMTKTYPEDVYGPYGARYYGHGDPELDQPSFDVMHRVRGNPDAEVDIYRAVPSDAPNEILPGDWVTTNPRYAKAHGEGFDDGGKILHAKTEAKRLRTDGNSPHEYGYTGAAGAAAVGLGAATQSQDADAGPIIDPKTGKRIIEAFHGSPHKFDKFDINKIGTGEGAQAYGHGLYFADSEDVARGYRDALTRDNANTERAFMDSMEAVGIDLYDEGVTSDALYDFAIQFNHNNGDLPATLADADRTIRLLEGDGQDATAIKATVRAIRKAQDRGFDVPVWSEGSLYRAHLDVDPDTLLDWDKPLSEQSEAVRAKLEAAGILDGDSVYTIEGAMPADAVSAGDMYDILTTTYGEGHLPGNAKSRMQGVSDYLSSLGIPGIRYQDGMSRGKDGGTYNYVMFDDANISIQERGMADVGLLGAIAAGTGTAITGVNNALNFAFDAMELPSRGLHGLAAALGVLAEGGDWNAAIERGAEVSGQSIDETAQELGQYVADKTGSAPAAALTDAITRVATLEP